MCVEFCCKLPISETSHCLYFANLKVMSFTLMFLGAGCYIGLHKKSFQRSHLLDRISPPPICPHPTLLLPGRPTFLAMQTTPSRGSQGQDKIMCAYLPGWVNIVAFARRRLSGFCLYCTLQQYNRKKNSRFLPPKYK